MRMVEIYLREEGLLGYRRMLVVEESQTAVALLDPLSIRSVHMKRSEFEALRPKTVAKDEARVRQNIAAAIARFSNLKSPKAIRLHRLDVRLPLARYALANLHHRHARFDMEKHLA